MSNKDINKNNLYKDFDVNPFKKTPPPKNDSDTTKKELDYLGKIKLNKRFFQDKDDILGNFFEFLDGKKIKYDKKQLKKIVLDAVKVILEIKDFYKRPRPFKLDDKFKDPLIKSTKGYSYPSGHSTQSNLLALVLTELYPKYKDDFHKIVEDIVYSRQMAKAHYPSDIKFGEKLAKSLFKYLKDNNLIKNELKESIRRILIQETSSSIRFRRRLDVAERLLDSLLDSMYPCDYEDEKTFLDGVIYELGWLVRDDDYGLGEYWDEVWDYIGRVKADEIYEYYRERCKK